MLKMLEAQAENLEDLVAERTKELGEEKKKVEMLLYNILPRYTSVIILFLVVSSNWTASCLKL